MTGANLLPLVILLITNGPSGYLKAYSLMVMLNMLICQSTGAKNSERFYPMMKSSMEKSERGGYPVIRKNLKQWVIDQPQFAESLLSGLDKID